MRRKNSSGRPELSLPESRFRVETSVWMIDQEGDDRLANQRVQERLS
jgi:hypothetical protein